MTHRLLFGDDGSASADVAWLWINNHDWPGWTIEALTALDGGTAPELDTPRELLRSAVADGLVTQVVREDPRRALSARARDCHLLVIGSKGRGLMKALHVGSTAEWLMHEPPAPLVIARGAERTERILLAHDGSVHARAVEESIAALPWAGEVEVLVITVSDSLTEGGEVTQSAAQRLNGHVGDIDTQVLTPSELALFYRPRDILLDTIRSWRADLVALGSRGLSSWESINESALHRAGSTATALASHAPCSVLLARGSG